MPNQSQPKTYEQQLSALSLHQGPKDKGLATQHLERILNAFLLESEDNPATKVICKHNALGELEVTIGSTVYNLTVILQHRPDYEQIKLDRSAYNLKLISNKDLTDDEIKKSDDVIFIYLDGDNIKFKVKNPNSNEKEEIIEINGIEDLLDEEIKENLKDFLRDTSGKETLYFNWDKSIFEILSKQGYFSKKKRESEKTGGVTAYTNSSTNYVGINKFLRRGGKFDQDEKIDLHERTRSVLLMAFFSTQYLREKNIETQIKQNSSRNEGYKIKLKLPPEKMKNKNLYLYTQGEEIYYSALNSQGNKEIIKISPNEMPSTEKWKELFDILSKGGGRSLDYMFESIVFNISAKHSYFPAEQTVYRGEKKFLGMMSRLSRHTLGAPILSELAFTSSSRQINAGKAFGDLIYIKQPQGMFGASVRAIALEGEDEWLFRVGQQFFYTYDQTTGLVAYPLETIEMTDTYSYQIWLKLKELKTKLEGKNCSNDLLAKLDITINTFSESMASKSSAWLIFQLDNIAALKNLIAVEPTIKNILSSNEFKALEEDLAVDCEYCLHTTEAFLGFLNRDILKAAKYVHEPYDITTKPEGLLAHSLRKAALVDLVVNYFSEFSSDQGFQSFCRSMDEQTLKNIQIVMLFIATENNKLTSEKNFMAYANDRGMNDSDTLFYSNLIYLHSFDISEIAKMDVPRRYFSYIISLSNNLDLMYCCEPEKYENSVLEVIKAAGVNLKAQEKAGLDQLYTVADCGITTTGDKQLTTFKNGNLKGIKNEYNAAVFEAANSNPETCWRMCMEAKYRQQEFSSSKVSTDTLMLFAKSYPQFAGVLLSAADETNNWDLYCELLKNGCLITPYINSARSFYHLFAPLTQEQRTVIYEVYKEKLPKVIKTVEDINYLLKYLTPEQCSEVCKKCQEKLRDIIKTTVDFKNAFEGFTAKQCASVCLQRIETAEDFYNALDWFSPDRRTEIYEACKEKLPDMIKGFKEFMLVFEYLTPEQCTEIILKRVRSFDDFEASLKSIINEEKYAEVFEACKGKLNYLITTMFELENIVRFLPEQQKTQWIKTLGEKWFQTAVTSKLNLERVLKIFNEEQQLIIANMLGKKKLLQIKIDLSQDDCTNLEKILNKLPESVSPTPAINIDPNSTQLQPQPLIYSKNDARHFFQQPRFSIEEHLQSAILKKFEKQITELKKFMEAEPGSSIDALELYKLAKFITVAIQEFSISANDDILLAYIKDIKNALQTNYKNKITSDKRYREIVEIVNQVEKTAANAEIYSLSTKFNKKYSQ